MSSTTMLVKVIAVWISPNTPLTIISGRTRGALLGATQQVVRRRVLEEREVQPSPRGP